VDIGTPSLLVASTLLFIWGVAVTPLSIILSNRYRIVDLPGGRKTHSSVTPRGAGIVLWLGFLLWSLYAVTEASTFRALAFGGTLVFLSGYWDDMRTLKPGVRLLFHAAASGIFLIALPGFPLRHWPVCLLWVAGMINAFNLVDGVNGLCLSVFIASSLALSAFGFAGAFAPVAALAAGVLPWNFPRAKTFLGDGGTTLLGFLYSTLFICSTVDFIDGVPVLELPFYLFLIGGIPAADTLFAIMRRSMKGRSPFSPDRGHIHHRLMDRGWGQVSTVVFLSTAHLLLLAGGLFFLGRYIL
jgi:UDP-GlcNAc:undecaprenyl-phosphate GlcNAc-1-phosphate transferase